MTLDTVVAGDAIHSASSVGVIVGAAASIDQRIAERVGVVEPELRV